MVSYAAPLDEIGFVLHEVLGYGKVVAGLPGCAEATGETLDAVFGEAARFCEAELLPLNRPGDEAGCRFANGTVSTPPGFREAYRAFAGNGWTGLTCEPAHGGQGLPKVVQVVLDEIVSSSNLAFGITPGLSRAVYHGLLLHGTQEQRKLLPALASGRWSGTMCLTEPQCGTDLGLIRTRAEPDGAGGYRLSGGKIFISAGDHDLTENILHLVLARLPDAPSGTDGISMFLVPKFEIGPDGAPGARNGVTCGGIEHKMGIMASPTCQLQFEGAAGTLVGTPNGGLAAMFSLMNAARLAVGVQGLGLAETAYQSAVAYARERLQGRSLDGTRYPDRAADPILVHPDVRRMLLAMRTTTEALRALALWCGIELDVAERHPDPVQRQGADDLVALLTPIVKAFGSDHGFAAANLALQVHGGHGYIRETGVEQLVRDARITQIYEGANGIQALDLVGRKLPRHSGRLLRRFFHPVAAFIEARQDVPTMAPLAKAFSRLQRATHFVAQQGLADREAAGAAASDYLRLFALVALGYLWARMAEAALTRPETDPLRHAKLAGARFFMARVLPETSALFAAILSGKGPLMDYRDDWF